MNYPVANIVEDVRIALDQNQDENSIIAQEDNTLEFEAIIRQKILHAARHLLETSDVSVLGQGKTCYVVNDDPKWSQLDTEDYVEIRESETQEPRGELSVWEIDLPPDYLRLLSLRMSDWKRGVHATISFEGAEYSELQSPFAGITGNPIRPVVAEVKRSLGTAGPVSGTDTYDYELNNRRFLEVYTSATGDVADFRYCPIPMIDQGDCLDFPEKLYRMLIYQAAALTASTYKDSALAQLLMNMVYEGEPQDKEEQ